MNLRLLFNSIFLLAVWLPVMEILELEWRYNEQYHYGYFVPFFALYLIYLRWEDRPETHSPSLSHYFILVPLLSFVPLLCLQTANPDWRLIYWLGAAAATITTVLWFDQLGGKKWVRHFTPALVIILFSVPWLTSVENRVTNSLMGIVSVITVEVLNLTGIYAVQMGNVIHLKGAVVGVEEACSGVRSLQSSLMAGYLFGEILRFRFSLRFLLILLGVGVTFFLNLMRTLLLTNITLQQGTEAFEKWHDPIGNAIAIGGFLSIALLAWMISKMGKRSKKDPSLENPPSLFLGTSLLPTSSSILFSSVIGAALAFDALWYLPIREEHTSFDYSNIQWDQISDDAVSLEMDSIAAAQLKYTTGAHYNWTSSSGIHWTAFYFNWESGNISSHAGVHRPENCLPASGMVLETTHKPQSWKTPEGYEIPFQTMTFEGFGRQTYVFFAVWDENGSKPWISTTWSARIQDAYKRRIVKGRHSLQFLAENARSFNEAQEEWLIILDRMYAPDGKPEGL